MVGEHNTDCYMDLLKRERSTAEVTRTRPWKAVCTVRVMRGRITITGENMVTNPRKGTEQPYS